MSVVAVIFLLQIPTSLSQQHQVPPGLQTGHQDDQGDQVVRQGVQDLSWHNGACRSGLYTGEVNLAGAPDGQGTYTCTSHTYTGGWREGVRHGRGVNTYNNGDIYTGDWDNDERSVILILKSKSQIASLR